MLRAETMRSLSEDVRNMLAALRLTSLAVYISVPRSIKDSSKSMHELRPLAERTPFSIDTESTGK